MSKKSAAKPRRRAELGPGSGVRAPAVVHVDLDGIREIAGAWGWDVPAGPDTLFETGLRAALDMFERHAIRATLFTVANSLDDPARRELLEEAIAAGHEIASHTLTHPKLRTLTTDEKRRELGESRRRLVEELGVPVEGFRAPGYQLDRECLEILAESGYSWDSSAFPTRSFAEHLETTVEALSAPTARLDGLDVGELPLPDHRPFPVPFNPSYSILLGMAYMRWGVRRVARRGLPIVLLFHLIDFAEPLPAGAVPGLRGRVLTLSTHSQRRKIAACESVIAELGRHFDLVDTAELVARTT